MHGRGFLVGERELAIRVADFLAGTENTIVIPLPPDWTETLRISEYQYAFNVTM